MYDIAIAWTEFCGPNYEGWAGLLYFYIGQAESALHDISNADSSSR